MAQASCDEVTLLLDHKFLQCEQLLFHPMQSDFTTALGPDQLTAFLERAAPGRHAYVDLSSDAKIDVAPGPLPPAAPERKLEAKPESVKPSESQQQQGQQQEQQQ
ncbi:unnamed protein product [Polarella glacialis]|uniref:YbaK/aminoacyl-tRNA synthetase-associated domain-containing protein n=1 Tax=Polarella glacialis TaxID=89957 RepID=A0A813LGR5_POLGL|nr:unnamed protein product [Polarella glacialis]